MKKKITHSERISGRFGAALAMMAILLANFSLQAQYESFFGQEKWSYDIVYAITCKSNDYDPGLLGGCVVTFPYEFYIHDTVRIGDFLYQKERFTSTFLREDTLNGRLYARYGLNDNQEEYLLCDMSISVGDTFVLNGSAHWSPYDEDRTMTVDSVSHISGKKVVFLSMTGPSDMFFNGEFTGQYNISLKFIEGVGPMFGIHPPVSLEPHLGLLLCVHKDDTLYYMTHEDLGCEQFGVDVPTFLQTDIQVFPNPFDRQLTLDIMAHDELSGVVFIRDVAGRACKQMAITERLTKIDVTELPQGVYFLTYVDENSHKITKKIIKK